MQENMEWATTQYFFFSLSHNTTNCIVTGKAGRQRAGARHDTAQQSTIRPSALRYSWAARDMTRSARGWEQGRDIKICIVVEGATLSRDMTALRCDTAQQRATIRCREARHTT